MEGHAADDGTQRGIGSDAGLLVAACHGARLKRSMTDGEPESSPATSTSNFGGKMRWENGGPPQLYVGVHNNTGEIKAFYRLGQRTSWIEHVQRPQDFTLLTYVQKPKRK